ncbi:MAG: transcriptional regulator PadR family [Clostridia bacterium]|uniref:PadR family transcriptional regulator n=1 Tax=Petroclostridium xylanilyticum TaxID=1792311 RepID=UPI000B989D51|nr:PadR family transcriptional regulator [Petroclostridium xylanilyticum]MBZ4645695.1 transcriptional regulator PadR family [Clostridia bacterium]
MKDKIIRRLFLGFIQIHVLYHAKQEPFFGLYMIEELKSHGYDMSPGTLYPILHSMEQEGLLYVEKRVIEGKVRKYYSLTEKGNDVLNQAKEKALELIKEIRDK